MNMKAPQMRDVDSSQVDRWECPFCDFDSEDEEQIRSHINVTADSAHKNTTGYSVELPAYSDGEKLGEFNPEKAELNIASSGSRCDTSDIDLPVKSDEVGPVMHRALKIWSEDLTLTAEEVKNRLREEGFDDIGVIGERWGKVVDTTINDTEFKRTDYAVVQVIEDMENYSDTSEVIEEYRSRGYDRPADPTIESVVKRYEEAVESEEQESGVGADGGVAREEIEELLNSDLTEKQEAVVRAFNRVGLDTKSDKVAEVAEEEFGVEVSSTYPAYIKREKILAEDEPSQEGSATEEAVQIISEETDTPEEQLREDTTDVEEVEVEPIEENSSGQQSEENSEETSDNTTNDTMSESTITVDDVEQVHEKIGLIEEFGGDKEAQVARRIREMIDSDLLEGGDSE